MQHFYIQGTVLYTDQEGKRRVRVVTARLRSAVFSSSPCITPRRYHRDDKHRSDLLSDAPPPAPAPQQLENRLRERQTAGYDRPAHPQLSRKVAEGHPKQHLPAARLAAVPAVLPLLLQTIRTHVSLSHQRRQQTRVRPARNRPSKCGPAAADDCASHLLAQVLPGLRGRRAPAAEHNRT